MKYFFIQSIVNIFVAYFDDTDDLERCITATRRKGMVYKI